MCGQGFCGSYYWGLQYHRPEDLSLSQWQKSYSRAFYLAYRAFMFLAVIAHYIAKLVIKHQEGQGGYFFIFLTNWGLTLLLIHMLSDMVLVAVELYFYEKNDRSVWTSMTVAHKINWVLYTANVSGSLFISVFYWGLLYPTSNDALDYFNFFSHASNSIINLIDLFVVAKPFRLQHFYIPVCLGVLYVTFSLIYWAAGGLNDEQQPYIYSKLNWKQEPGAAVAYTFGAIALVIIVHFLIYGLYRLRLVIAAKCGGIEHLDKELHPSRIEPTMDPDREKALYSRKRF